MDPWGENDKNSAVFMGNELVMSSFGDLRILFEFYMPKIQFKFIEILVS